MTTETTTKERPILFSGEMIRAILDGRKIQTRRVVKPQPFDFADTQWGWFGPGVLVRWGGNVSPADLSSRLAKYCPYGVPGDRLWVRETWALVPRTAYRGSEGVQQILRPDDDHDAAVYRAGWNRSEPGRWRPSIHMPRWASRLTLEITGIRVERVHDISEADARAEGIRDFTNQHGAFYGVNEADCWERTAVESFHRLWNSINEARGYGWAVNPWCWVLEFRGIEP